jgi:hypothetical protein
MTTAPVAALFPALATASARPSGTTVQSKAATSRAAVDFWVHSTEHYSASKIRVSFIIPNLDTGEQED